MRGHQLVIILLALTITFPGYASAEPPNSPAEDCAEDVACYRYAAAHGDAHAQNALGFIYAEGQGVPQDLVEAYAWWGAAAMNGITAARERLETTRSRLAFPQVETAQMLAMNYFLSSAR